MFSIFKNKEVRQKESLNSAEQNIKILNDKYSDIINSYCMFYNYVFIFKGFCIKENIINIQFIDKDTPESYISLHKLWIWELKYGNSDLHTLRDNWLKFKKQLNGLGLKIDKI